jgi:hypothetical protein
VPGFYAAPLEPMIILTIFYKHEAPPEPLLNVVNLINNLIA